jgi:LysR family hydrogen peroxide-inducible transcriptional activator
MQYAVAVADLRSFRRAAERCHVSQPSLSAQVAELESLLGVVLFERDRRHVVVTSLGSELLSLMQRTLAEANALVAAAQRVGDPFSGVLRVGVIPTVSPYLLPRVAPALRARFAKLSVQWREERTASLLAALRDATLDAAVLARVGGMEGLDVLDLVRDPFDLAVSASHPLGRARGPVDLDVLDDADILLLDEGHCLRDQALAACARVGVREAPFRATSLTTLIQMVASGAGVTLLPRMAVDTELRRGALRVRRFKAPSPERVIVCAWRKQSPIAAALRTVAEALRDAAA